MAEEVKSDGFMVLTIHQFQELLLVLVLVGLCIGQGQGHSHVKCGGGTAPLKFNMLDVLSALKNSFCTRFMIMHKEYSETWSILDVLPP